jgi:cysteinyl-tRNA synthetase
LNTPQALAVLWDVLKSNLSDEEKSSALLKMDEVLGLGLKEVIGKPAEVPDWIRKLAEERSVARGEKDWKKSDELREKIESLGWRVEDKNRGDFDLIPL